MCSMFSQHVGRMFGHGGARGMILLDGVTRGSRLGLLWGLEVLGLGGLEALRLGGVDALRLGGSEAWYLIWSSMICSW